MKKLLLALLLMATPATAGTFVVAEYNPGGQIGTFLTFWRGIADSGVNVVIDAPCVSACTIVLGMVPEDRICVTSRGSFGFHEASDDSGPQAEFTKAMSRWIYPRWVQEWIGKHPLTADVQYMWPEDMKDHIKLCPGSVYPSVNPDNLIKTENAAPEGLPIPHPIRETVKPKDATVH